MRYGFIKAASGTPEIRVADCKFNQEQILNMMRNAARGGAQLLVLPELCLTGYTCGDLFLQKKLLEGALAALDAIIEASAELSLLTIVGAPLQKNGKLYNCAVVISSGNVLGAIPKTHLPNYSEYYEQRHFTSAPEGISEITLGKHHCPFGTKLLFRCRELPELTLGVEICEDLWVVGPPSIRHAAAGATVIANPSAGDETIGKEQYRRDLVSGQSARLVCGYIYAGAGDGESTTDMVFSGHSMIAENGAILNESRLFQNGLIMSEIDVDRLSRERQRITTFPPYDAEGYTLIPFSLKNTEVALTRKIPMHPFVPSDLADR